MVIMFLMSHLERDSNIRARIFFRSQDGLIIPPGWLCYLAPEIMRHLRVHVKPDDEHLPFSKASDVYAFG